MNRSNRFFFLDYLRLFAAIAVVFGHSFALSVHSGQEIFFYIFDDVVDIASLAVNLFFFISGYLMVDAIKRNSNVIFFMRNRLARISPGIVFASLFCILVGAFFTTYSLTDYFLDKETFYFFKNVLFLFTTSLPGVFSDNPYPNVVNGSLWTIFYEMLCYVVLIFSVKIFKDNLNGLFILFIILLTFVISLSNPSEISAFNNFIRLSFFFIFGYLFKAKFFEFRSTLILLILIFVFVFSSVFFKFYNLNPKIYTYFFCVSIFVILIKLMLKIDGKFKPLSFDISFGIYIYSFPIQQAILSICSEINPFYIFIYSMLIILPVSYISWVFIEKPWMNKIKNMS